jgi:hypothetical protein
VERLGAECKRAPLTAGTAPQIQSDYTLESRVALAATLPWRRCDVVGVIIALECAAIVLSAEANTQ